MQSLRNAIIVLICIGVLILLNSSSALAQRYEELPGIEGGDLVPVLVVGGAALLIPALIPNPKPDIHVEEPGLRDFFQNLNEEAKQKPFMIKPVSGKKQFGRISSVESESFVLEGNGGSQSVTFQSVKEIMDLRSASKRAKTSRVENAIRFGLLGIMAFQTASILDDEGSSTAATLMQVSGAAWFGGSLLSIAIKSQEEKQYETWQYEAGAEPLVTEATPTGDSNPPQIHRAGSEVTGEGALLVGGAFSYSSQGGDLYESGNERLTTVAIVPSVFYFVSPGVGVGGDLSYNRTSQGRSALTAWGVGPKAGYFFESGSNLIPFASGGLNLLSIGDRDNSETGFRIKFGGGVLLRKDHLAISVEAAYMMDRFKPEGFEKSITGNTLALGVGFGGFLY